MDKNNFEDEKSAPLAPTKLGSHTVPGIWRFMFPDDLFYFRVDDEKKSTCFACPKVKEAGFHPNIRCCTVIPKVPNFLIGFALKAENPLMTAYLERASLLPEGLLISPRELDLSLAYIHRPGAGEPGVVCPFLEHESKRCGIYAFRSTTCSSYFCKTERAEASRIFWSDLADLGSQIETLLAQWAMTELGISRESLEQHLGQYKPDLGSDWPEDLRRDLFGPWAGREKDFFIAAADLIWENRTRLFEIARTFKGIAVPSYDAKLRELFQPHYTPELIDEALPVGEFESVDSLWYSLKLSARNLQIAPKS